MGGLWVVGAYVPVGQGRQWGPGRCFGRGSVGRSPPEAEAFLSIDTQILMF